jgi:hypothetical protein
MAVFAAGGDRGLISGNELIKFLPFAFHQAEEEGEKLRVKNKDGESED